MITLWILSIASIQITPDTATVGDPLSAVIKGEITDSLAIIMPDSFPDIVLLDSLVREGDSLARVRFSSFSIGAQLFQIRVREDTLKGAYFIKSVLTPENKGLSPIWGPYGFFNWHYLLWLLIIPFASFVGYLIKKRGKEEIFKEEPEKEPGKEALGNLAILEGKIDDWSWNKIYTALSYIARRYIERKEGIPAVEATTSELLRMLKREDTKGFKPLIQRFSRWDLIKFADKESSMEEFEGDLTTTRSVIENMKKEENDTLS